MRRREFIAPLASATAARPLIVHAQQSERTRRIGGSLWTMWKGSTDEE